MVIKMSESHRDYHRYVEALEGKQHQQVITHTVYSSRRAIWATLVNQINQIFD